MNILHTLISSWGGRFLTNMSPFIKKIFTQIFNTRAAGFYLLSFAAVIGLATFIENDFGTTAAQKVIYKSWWFELLMILFAGTIIRNIYKFRMIPQRKWALLSFHLAIVIILIGAALTRYLGFEGIMHIRENDSSDVFLSADSYLKFVVEKEGETYEFDEAVLFASIGNNNWEGAYLIGNDLLEIKLREFIPNPKQMMRESLDGVPTLKLVVAGLNGREEYYLRLGESKRISNSLYNFSEKSIPGAINIRYEGESLLLKTDRMMTRTVMATQIKDTLYPTNSYTPLLLRALHSDGKQNFVFSEFHTNASLQIVSDDPKVKNESTTALELEVEVNGEKKETYVFGNKGAPGRSSFLRFGKLSLGIAYGSKEIKLPFSLALKDFIMEKYPGTNSASSYASEVVLRDPRNNKQLDFRIFMNNILNYDGYRFFQSSFDRDEQGTYLSVNSDFWGTTISYLGYAILTIGMFLTFFSKKTRFYQLNQKLKKIRANKTLVILCLLAFSLPLKGQGLKTNAYLEHAIDADHASEFSKVVVQDFKGRMKPMHTLSREILRKLARKQSLNGLSADQIILGMFVNSKEWHGVPIIKLSKHKEVLKLIGVDGNHAAYKDFFNTDGSYKLRDEVRRAYSLDPVDRGVYEKDLLKIDERVNIMSMVYSGSILKIIPGPNDPNNSWSGFHSHGQNDGHNHSSISDKFFNAYGSALQTAIISHNYAEASNLIQELKEYQHNHGGAILPSERKVKYEILLNQSDIFTRLSGIYLILGLGFLSCMFLSVFRPKLNLKKAYQLLFSVFTLGFLLHTIGLGIRWYVSGRAPWSNGYESMIYIAWTSTLAGAIFTRKSFGGLAATMVLAATILFVATLSFLDPEITPLVPVLKSYWLTIHVSMEAGSYGFLMLGAIIGLINLILMIFLKESNKTRIKSMVQEMSYLSELTLLGGLFMISVGTYLGGVWANESWGRYWGWDAKETWALVTILIYAFILHMRIIPKLTGLFAYNLATIFGLASVIMTYYGVNYYLSGLHSYATGDPVPVPTWVYIVVATIIGISTLAFIKKRKFPIIT